MTRPIQYLASTLLVLTVVVTAGISYSQMRGSQLRGQSTGGTRDCCPDTGTACFPAGSYQACKDADGIIFQDPPPVDQDQDQDIDGDDIAIACDNACQEWHEFMDGNGSSASRSESSAGSASSQPDDPPPGEYLACSSCSQGCFTTNDPNDPLRVAACNDQVCPPAGDPRCDDQASSQGGGFSCDICGAGCVATEDGPLFECNESICPPAGSDYCYSSSHSRSSSSYSYSSSSRSYSSTDDWHHHCCRDSRSQSDFAPVCETAEGDGPFPTDCSGYDTEADWWDESPEVSQEVCNNACKPSDSAGSTGSDEGNDGSEGSEMSEGGWSSSASSWSGDESSSDDCGGDLYCEPYIGFDNICTPSPKRTTYICENFRDRIGDYPGWRDEFQASCNALCKNTADWAVTCDSPGETGTCTYVNVMTLGSFANMTPTSGSDPDNVIWNAGAPDCACEGL